MARRIPFSLKMADGALVRTIEELREHFDLETVLSYYDNGRLGEWLTGRYYDEEAEKIEDLRRTSEDFKKNLCDVLGVSYSEYDSVKIDFSGIEKKNERRERLKKFTADDAILANLDHVAFTQEEMEDLLDKGDKVIYLFGDQFVIPGAIGDITYIGVNNPWIKINGEIVEQGINFQGLEFHIDNITYGDKGRFYNLFDKNREAGTKLLRMAAEKGFVQAQCWLGECYEKGFGVDKNAEDAVRWYREAAEHGYAEAQNFMGNAYNNGYSVKQDFVEAVQWYKKSAEQEFTYAQNNLGNKYWRGEGVNQSYEEANKWYLKAAGRGYHWAQYNLGISYRDGKGIQQDQEKAIEWLQKSFNQGNESAKLALIEINPQLFKLSDVILCAIGDSMNLNYGTKIDVAAGIIDVYVDDRYKVDTTILNRFGATEIWMETTYYTYTRERPSVKQTVREFGGLLKAIITNNVEHSWDDSNTNIIETVSEDLGGGCIHMRFTEISSDMEEDFNNNIISKCSNSFKESDRKLKLLLE